MPPFAGVYRPVAPILTRRSCWGAISEAYRPDGAIRHIRVYPPGTSNGERRMLLLADLSMALGAAGGLIIAVLLQVTSTLVLAGLVLGGGLAVWALLSVLTRRLRAGIRSLTATESWEDASDDELAALTVFDAASAVADLMDADPSLSAVEREVLWGRLYFLVPAGRPTALGIPS
ncbi:DUF6611 family protein [Microbacterium sp. P04]|uniref:DUF6611 family protein n=1 Tax=Microbacterium sp. P04 TaxID=3366947 RepID=UPI003746EF24